MIEPHNCFACGSLNVHGLHLELHAGDDRCWTELELDRRFEGWEGIAHGGIVCTILDEVMAWALVDHDLWGVTARMQRRLQASGPDRPADPRRGPRPRDEAAGVYAEGVLVDVEDGTELARAEATFVGAPEARKQELKERYGFRLEAEGRATDARPHARHGGPRRDGRSRPMTDRDATPPPRAPRPSSPARSSPSARPTRPTALGRTPASTSTTRTALVTHLSGRPCALADPEYLDGHAPRRARHRACPRCPPAAPPRDRQRPPCRHARRARSTLLDIAARLVREPVIELHWLAFGILERTILRRARAFLAARPCRAPRDADNWTTVDTLAHVPRSASSPRPTAGPSSSSSCTRRRAGSAGWPGSTIATLPFADRSAGRRPRSRARPALARATSSATPRRTSRRRSRGRSAR